MSYGFKMAGDVTEVRAAGMLKEIEDELGRTIRVSCYLWHPNSKVHSFFEVIRPLGQIYQSMTMMYFHVLILKGLYEDPIESHAMKSKE